MLNASLRGRFGGAGGRLASRRVRTQRGLSLVELMVGIAIGLFVVAGATLVVSSQLGDNRRLLLETQLQQDLRASLDIVTRELRRIGRVADSTALAGLAYPEPTMVAHNNLAPLVSFVQDPGRIEYRYRRGGDEGPFGFQLDGVTLKSRLGVGWQDLTDPSVMRITAFSITPVTPAAGQPPLRIPCPRACSADANDIACWPTLAVRTYVIAIAAEAVHDAAIRRELRSEVRLRNDWLQFDDPLGPVCPP